MATIETNGLDSLILSMEELAATPDSVIDNMLMAGGEIIAKGHEKELTSMGLVKSRTLKDSIKVFKKRSKGTRYVLVYPAGAHHTYNGRTGSYIKMNWGRAGGVQSKGSGTKVATNNDVGFVHEFGGHGNNASQWMRVANEKNAGKAVDAEAKVYNDWLTQKGL